MHACVSVCAFMSVCVGVRVCSVERSDQTGRFWLFGGHQWSCKSLFHVHVFSSASNHQPGVVVPSTGYSCMCMPCVSAPNSHLGPFPSVCLCIHPSIHPSSGRQCVSGMLVLGTGTLGCVPAIGPCFPAYPSPAPEHRWHLQPARC